MLNSLQMPPPPPPHTHTPTPHTPSRPSNISTEVCKALWARFIDEKSPIEIKYAIIIIVVVVVILLLSWNTRVNRYHCNEITRQATVAFLGRSCASELCCRVKTGLSNYNFEACRMLLNSLKNSAVSVSQNCCEWWIDEQIKINRKFTRVLYCDIRLAFFWTVHVFGSQKMKALKIPCDIEQQNIGGRDEADKHRAYCTPSAKALIQATQQCGQTRLANSHSQS